MTCPTTAPSSPTSVLITAEAGGTADGFRIDGDRNLRCGWGMSPIQNGVTMFDNAGAGRRHRAAWTRRECLFRRRQAQPAVHGNKPLGLLLHVNTQGVKGG